MVINSIGSLYYDCLIEFASLLASLKSIIYIGQRECVCVRYRETQKVSGKRKREKGKEGEMERGGHKDKRRGEGRMSEDRNERRKRKTMLITPVAQPESMQSVGTGHLQASSLAANDSSSRKCPPVDGLLLRADDLCSQQRLSFL